MENFVKFRRTKWRRNGKREHGRTQQLARNRRDLPGRPDRRRRDNVRMEQLDAVNQEKCVQGKKIVAVGAFVADRKGRR